MAPLGGIVADRNNRHRVVIGDAGCFDGAGVYARRIDSYHRIQVWHIFVLASLLGVVNAFDIPGRQSFLVDMVGREDMMNAIALNSSMFNGARIVGPAIAGILVAKIGEGWCFFAQRSELYSGDCRAADDEGCNGLFTTRRRDRRSITSLKVFVSPNAPPPSGIFCCCLAS